MKLFGIIGHPLSHTLSPILHNWGFRELGIPASYHVWDTPPDKLQAFMAALRTLPIHGASVTIPHKEAVMPLVDAMTKTARLIGAVNTLYWENGKLWGDNTDVTGFMAPLLERGIAPGTALILGAGGAARAALCGLHQAGWKVLLSSRTETRADRLAQAFQTEHVAWAERHRVQPDLMVNTTPLGMSGPFHGLSPWKESLTGISLVYDLIYNPRQTPLLAQAEREGVATIPGLPMFAHQGLAQFERWTGQRFDIVRALDLLDQTLKARATT
jgi:shikimate dehydrogenase